MSDIRIGIVGAGWIANQHLTVLRALPGIQVVGITSRTESKARILADQFSIPVVAPSIEELIHRTTPNALMILVSADQMFSVTHDVIRYGVPIFVEKPAGLTVEENKILARRAEEYKICSMVGFNRRYYSIFSKGVDIIKQHGPLLGVSIEGHERMWLKRDGKWSEDILKDWMIVNGVHTIDLLRYFGGEPEHVDFRTHRYHERRGDQFVAIMNFSSGALGQYSAFWYSPGGWSVTLFGDGVTIQYKPLEKGVWIDTQFVSHELLPDEIDTTHKPGFYRQMEAFRNLVVTGKKEWPLQDLGDSVKTMQIAEQILLNEQS